MALDFGGLKKFFALGGGLNIGIDVGASAVKVVGLRGNQGQLPKLVGCALEETPMGCIVDGMLSDTRTMAEVVRSALGKAGINYKDVPAAVGLRGLNVVYKRLVLPFQKPEEMARQVLLDAQQQVDTDLAEWIIDYQVLTQPDPQGQVVVMLVAAKRAAVEEYMSLKRLIGVRPAVFDCDVFAISNAHEHAFGVSGDTVLCVDVGRDTTKINVLQGGIPLLVRSFPVGGAHLTEQISKALAIDYDQADSMKISESIGGDSGNVEISAALEGHVSEVCEEIQRTIEFFSSAGSESKIEGIDRVFLSGGGAGARGLADGIGRFLKAQVVYANPFQRISVPGKWHERLEGFQHLYSVAVGLALRFEGDKPQ